ncbi:MAG: tetratricopeptide repeat protein [Planctomycetota bacterium]|nr:tetratricopeptide repeat protein [Planctomycetota bacterium]MDA1211849.1 tetratricopeptide repeat protein [Planctomycetota bacterium]
MKRPGTLTLFVLAILSGLFCLNLYGQAKPDQADSQTSSSEVVDEVSRQAMILETELSKYKATAPEAADVMVELADLYHANGRAFGLIRVTQRFVGAHPDDNRHQQMMLKLIDGLDAVSRNKEVTAACRQFLSNYPDAAECPAIEIRLADALLQMPNEQDATGDACRAVWKRQPQTDLGKRYALLSQTYYASSYDKNVYTKGAMLADEMLDEMPADGFLDEIAWQGVAQWRRGSEWAKSIGTAQKMIAKGIPTDKQRLRQIHYWIAQSYSSLGQWANAVASFKQARAMLDDMDIHYQIVNVMYNDAAIKAAEMDPVVTEFFQKYPDKTDRYLLRGLLALKYEREGEKATAHRLFGELLSFDAARNNHASAFLRTDPNNSDPNVPPNYSALESTLVQAIANNPTDYDRAYLRYVLAYELYRDRMKDDAKMRATLRELIVQSPTNDSYTRSAIETLLYTPESEQSFQADVGLILKSRRDHVELATFRNMPVNWADQAVKNDMHKAHAEYMTAQLAQADQDIVMRHWIIGESNDAAAPQSRDHLILTQLGALNDKQFQQIVSQQAYWLRYSAPADQRPNCVAMYGRLIQKFPKDENFALAYLQAATDYGPVEIAKAATEHMLTLIPVAHNAETYRRLALAVDQNKDPELMKKVLNWIAAQEQRLGQSVGYAYYIGDVLANLELLSDAMAYWRSHLATDLNQSDSYNCALRIARNLADAERMQFLTELTQLDTIYHGTYATWLADEYLKLNDLPKFQATLQAARKKQDAIFYRTWAVDSNPAISWIHNWRNNAEAAEADKKLIYSAVRDFNAGLPSAVAELALWELTLKDDVAPMAYLLALQNATRTAGDSTYDWDQMNIYAQSALSRKDYITAATLLTGMLSNIPAVDEGRKQSGREFVAQSYSRIGGVGVTIDEKSEIAPLLQAGLHLRLGDEDLAWQTYLNNLALFDAHRYEVPVDLMLFVCQRHIVAGGDDNHNRVEDILRGWLVKYGEAKEFDTSITAEVQLLLAKNFFQAKRFDVARSEYSTVMNRYPETPQAVEAEFGIGESFMAQKVYDQAESVFEKLSNSRDTDIVVRAEFLRGVLAHRRGDPDEARNIFRAVLDKVPSIELANQALYQLAEVYREEERYMDQLNLLNTVGRLGRASKRTHRPGTSLSVVVQDSDLGISRGQNKVPVIVTTEPGGDREIVYLTSGGAGRGLFRADLDTRLGEVVQGDHVLQLTGKDIIRCDYPDEFKKEFRKVPLSDVEIHMAADGKFEMASSRIVDQKQESFSDQLQKEVDDSPEAIERRASQIRPAWQVKPGNQIYLRVEDADRDNSNEPDEIVVRLNAESGDSLQVTMTETGPHTGIFEGTAPTGELPAGALASDTAIQHSPLMAIDRDPNTFWISEPDGATPKFLTVDMKDLKTVNRLRISSPRADQHIPIRGDILGSNDGQFWFRMASHPLPDPTPPVTEEFGHMKRRVFAGNYTGYSNWQQILNLSRNIQPVEEDEVTELLWSRPADAEDAAEPYTVIWEGLLVQDRPGAARIYVQGVRTAVWIDGNLELPVGQGNRSVDVWLEAGTHPLTIFAATTNAAQGVGATIAREDHRADSIVALPFRAADFDLDRADLKPATPRAPIRSDFGRTEWTMEFEPMELRYVKLMIHEFLGEAVAINHVEIAGEDDEIFIPTEYDILTLPDNDILEIAGGDIITGTYTDEFTQGELEHSRLLSSQLTATYYNASVTPITYEFQRNTNGNVFTIRKTLKRIEPGERFIVEIVDFDHDQTDEPDTLPFELIASNGDVVEYIATETNPNTGIFTKEIDTSAVKENGKIHVQKGDRLYLRYIDTQNTFPGHAVPRETAVYVNQPSEGQIRILESRVIPAADPQLGPPQFIYQVTDDRPATASVAFEAPLTIEVIDPDSAKDSGSKVTVSVKTTDGAIVDVECVVSGAFTRTASQVSGAAADAIALEDGRFVGQVILQLGSKASPTLVPVHSEMPRNLIGGPNVDDENGKTSAVDRSLVTKVLNLTGKDRITGIYKDELRPKGKAQSLAANARLVTTGKLACTDREYNKLVTQLHVGERLFLRVDDADRDVTDDRDAIEVEITTEFGDKELIPLFETLQHSGQFTGSLTLKPSEKPTPNNISADDPAIECFFGDTLSIRYFDPSASTEQGKLELLEEIPVVIGTDGLVTAFSKTFNNEQLAVETKFHIAESYFELFKSHQELGRKADFQTDLEAGRRVLKEVMEDYPDPKYVPRIAYLLGQFSQELKQWHEAIQSYDLIVRQYSDHSLAADAQYKLAQCHEEAGDFDQALEAYVTLAATYPKSPLIASVMIRISDYFYKNGRFEVAAQVGEKFLEQFEGHQHSSRMAFRNGQCYFKAESFVKAGISFDQFSKRFPDDALCSDAMFWSGESFRKANNNVEAFRRYNRCRWDFPASEAAKFARGRLALPEMLQQFESEASAVENDN